MVNPQRAAKHASSAAPRRPRTTLAFDKVIRDSFTMPAADYALIGTLKERCVALGVAMKKSELLRAGLAVLHRLPDEVLAQVVSRVESVKTGRPPGKRKSRKAREKKSRSRKR